MSTAPRNSSLCPKPHISTQPITLLGSFEKDAARWATMPYINIHDGTTHTLNPPTILVLPQTFELVFCERFANHRLVTGGWTGEGCDSSQVTNLPLVGQPIG
jgi:hypothetical protein